MYLMERLQHFVSELQRRKVARVAAGYIVAAWIILQVAVALQTAMSLAAAFSAAILALLVIGFPVAVVVSWFFDFTPEGIRRTVSSGDGSLIKPQTPDIILAAMLALVLIVALVQAVMPREGAPAVTAATEAPKPKPLPATLGDKSIAVLPFANLSPDKADEYFADGLTEELLNLLAKIGDLKVISRTSSFAFKGKEIPLPEIAKQLGVRHILEGSVRTSGDQLRVTAQLIDVSTDTHLWSETYERKIDSIFSLQDEIARAIAAALKVEVTLSGGEHNAPTRNLQAYRLYLEGRILFSQRGAPAARPQIAKVFKNALALDPLFAEAHAALAATYYTQSTFIPAQAAEMAALARASAQTAHKLKPTLGLPYAVLGALDRDEFKWELSIANAERSVALDPSDSTARVWLGIDRLALGQIEASAETFEAARHVDPFADIGRIWSIVAESARGNDATAMELAESIGGSSSYPARWGHYFLAAIAYDHGDAEKLRNQFQALSKAKSPRPILGRSRRQRFSFTSGQRGSYQGR